MSLTSKSKIDIVTTATIRPGILNQTLKSFCKHVIKNTSKFRLILNVDPIGNNQYKQKDVLKVAQKYFDDIVYNFPTEPGFTKAVIWGWTNVENDFVLHLEDDWIATKTIDLYEIKNILKEHPKLAALRFNKEKLRIKKLPKSKFIFDSKISLNPMLVKKEFVKNASKLMTTDRNPEKQLRRDNSNLGAFIKKWKYGIYVGDYVGVKVIDIGREWMDKSVFTKEIGFMNWTKK